MTKSQEIAWIDSWIKIHGDDSYLGQLLKEHRNEIVYAIKNDLPLEVVINREVAAMRY